MYTNINVVLLEKDSNEYVIYNDEEFVVYQNEHSEMLKFSLPIVIKTKQTGEKDTPSDNKTYVKKTEIPKAGDKGIQPYCALLFVSACVAGISLILKRSHS